MVRNVSMIHNEHLEFLLCGSEQELRAAFACPEKMGIRGRADLPQ